MSKLKSQKIIVIDLSVISEITFPSIETPSYHQVMEGKKILDGNAIMLERNYLTPFLSYLFENFKVGIWSSSKNEKYIKSVIEALNINRDKLEFIYSGKKCKAQYVEFYGMGHGLESLKDVNSVKGHRYKDILFIDTDNSRCVYNGNVLIINDAYESYDNTLLKLIDMLSLFKFDDLKSDYTGDIHYQIKYS